VVAAYGQLYHYDTPTHIYGRNMDANVPF